MIKLKDSNEIGFTLWWRKYNLELTKFLLQRYKETNEKFYYEQAKIFGEWSAKIKKEFL